MAKTLNFTALSSGTELDTPEGRGRFLHYKKGNFRNQNVRVELPNGKTVWYAENVLMKAVD